MLTSLWERSNRFSVFISVINCYDRCSITVDAGRQESRSVKSTATPRCQPELAGSQVSYGNTGVIFVTWVYATRRCSFQAAATTGLVLPTQNNSPLCTPHESNNFKVWLRRGGGLGCFSKFLRAFCHSVMGGSPVSLVSAVQCKALHSKVVLCKAHFKISVWEAVNRVSVF